MQVIKVSIIVTTGFVPGRIGATCEAPVMEALPVSYPVLVAITVIVALCSTRIPVTVTNPVELMLACPAVDETEYV